MKKNMITGKAAMIISAMMVVSAGSAVFAAANETILASEMGRTVEVAANNALPPAIPAVYAANADAPDFAKTDYSVVDKYGVNGRPAGSIAFPEAAISAQDAADIAAEYLWRVFDYSSKGKTFDMYSELEAVNFSLTGKPSEQYAEINPLGQRAVWNGYLSDKFIFSMDAITGEILSAHMEDLAPPAELVAMRSFDSPESVQFWNDHREEYLELAKGFAGKHLQTKIVSAAFESTIAAGVEIRDGELVTAVNEAGEAVPLTKHNLFDIRVTDEYGKEIIVSITDNTKELYEIYNADAIPPADLERNAQVRAEMGYK